MVKMNSPTLIGELFHSSQVIRGCSDLGNLTALAPHMFVPPYQLFLLLEIIFDYGESAAVIIQWKEVVLYAMVEHKYIYRLALPEL
jgi:hypothetical protein